MKKNKLVIRAFTLIELMVVISIILVFTGVSLVYYNVFTQERLLNTETDKLVSILELAKKNATSASGSVSTNCPSPLSPLTSTYQFRGNSVAVSNSARYSISNCCAPSDGGATSCPDIINSYKMKDPVNIANSPITVMFAALYGTAANTTIIVRLGTGTSTATKCYTITISSTGVITKSDMGTMHGSTTSCS